MLSAVAFAVIVAPVMPPFDASLKAHKGLRSASVSIESTTVTRRDDRSLKGFIQLQNGTKVKMTLTRNGKPFRWYLMDGTLLSGYDSANDEFLNLRISGKQKVLDKFLSAVPDADESARTVLDPTIMGKLYSRLKGVKKWQVKNGSTYFYTSPKTRFVVEFDPRTKYLKRFELTGGADRIRWNYRWGACGTISKFSIPVTAVKAAAFRAPKPAAIFGTEKARLAARLSVRAYGALRSADMTIKTGQTIIVTMRGGKALVKAPNYEWRYDGHNILILIPSKKKAFVGTSTIFGLQEALAKANCETDAYAFQVVARKNPMRRLLYGGMKVKHIGSVSIDEQPCDLLEIANNEIRVTVAIRTKDHLIASESATYLESGAGMTSGSERQITYLTKSVSSSAFSTVVPKGYKAVKLK